MKEIIYIPGRRKKKNLKVAAYCRVSTKDVGQILRTINILKDIYILKALKILAFSIFFWKGGRQYGRT